MTSETRREALAALEHDQWIVWAGAIMGSEPISAARRARWEALMIPYTDLPEHQKDQDRKWADRVLTLFPSENPRREALDRLNPHDAQVIRLYAERNRLREEEAVSAFLMIAVNEYLADPIFTRKLDDHAAAVAIRRPYADPVPEPRSRW